MTTLVLQAVVAGLTVLFGALALRVALKSRNASELHRAAWMLTGIVFTILGISTAIQNVFAAPWAYFSGEGTPAYEAYLRFSPLGNHSRGFLVAAYGAMMAGLVWLCRWAKRYLAFYVVLVSVVAMAAGALFGWREGPLVRARHFTALAVSDTAELILLLAALFVAVVWNTTDRLLWLALAIFTVHELLDVASYSALAWARIPGAWAPSAKYIHLYASVAYALMAAVTVHRSRLAGRGEKVPGLLEPLSHPTPSLLA